MNYQVTLSKNNEIPLPDALCIELDLKIGDILLCQIVDNAPEIIMTKHKNQTLTDEEIASAGNLTRVISLP